MNIPLSLHSSAAAPQTPFSQDLRRRWQLLIVSAKSATALEQATDNLARHLADNADIDLADVAFTLQTGRQLFQYRRMLVCDNLNDAIDVLTTRDPERLYRTEQQFKNPSIALVLPERWLDTISNIRQLYAMEPVFRQTIDACAQDLQSRLGLDVRELWLSDDNTAPTTPSRAGDPGIVNALGFTAQYALASLYTKWGVRPTALLGYGVGRYVAACIAGIIQRRDALALVLAEARIGQHASGLSAYKKLVEETPLQQAHIPCLCGFSGVSLDQAGLSNTDRLNTQNPPSIDHDIVLEIGHGAHLPSLTQQETSGCKTQLLALSAFNNINTEQEPHYDVLRTLGILYLSDVKIDWNELHGDRQPHRVPLPTYPFEKKHCWFNLTNDADRQDRSQTAVSASSDGISKDVSVGNTLIALCQQLLGIENIGVHDNIMELGGDSMFTLQLSNEVARIYRVVITPHHLFQEPTVASLTEKVQSLLSSPAFAEYEEILNTVEQLSDVEVDRLLAKFHQSQ